MIVMTGQRRREKQTRRAVPSCHNQLPLSEWVERQANGITLTLGKTLGLLLTRAPIKHPSPGAPLVSCHKAAPLPIHLGGSPTGGKPPEEEAQKTAKYLPCAQVQMQAGICVSTCICPHGVERRFWCCKTLRL